MTESQPSMALDQWVIYSANEAATLDGAGFWNTGHGWCHEEDANLFTREEVGCYSLPISLGQDRRWLNLELARQTTEEALCEALKQFCTTENLPLSSADELLAGRVLMPYQRRWLEQFIRQWCSVIEV